MLLRPVTFPTAWKRVAATWWLIRTFMKCLRRKKKGSALITPMDGTNFRHNIAVGSPTVDPHNQKKWEKIQPKGCGDPQIQFRGDRVNIHSKKRSLPQFHSR